MRIYVAAPMGEKAKARAWAEALRAQRFDVVSSWHHENNGEDPTDRKLRGVYAERCTIEVTRSDALLFLDSEICQARGALVEMGVAIANKLPVVWLSPGKGRSIWDSYHGCFPVSDDAQVIHVLRLLLSQ